MKTDVANKSDAEVLAKYEIVWYVIKLQHSTGWFGTTEWHIDGVIKEKEFFSINYYGNGNTDGDAPTGTTTHPSTNDYVVAGPGDMVRVINGASVKFLGWSARADGSGAELDLSIFKTPIIILIGAVYVLFRALGKYIGAASSAKFSGCSPSIVKYLGITLLPQAGVALGMSVTAMEIGEVGQIVRNIILFSVLIYELVGPVLTKIALTKAGNIEPKPHEKHRKNRTAPSKI